MVKRNPNMIKLRGGYLFPEINKRKRAYLEKNPDAKLISLGIGDTTQPIPPHTIEGLTAFSKNLGSHEGYRGYGPEQGEEELRKRIADKLYHGLVKASDIFISDGSKCDIGRLQVMFGSDMTIAVQDPAYPVYVDTSVIIGQTLETSSHTGCYDGITYMPCTPENNFFTDLSSVPRTDILYITSPNNPTGTVLTHAQLAELVAFAKKNRSIIVFDAAYSMFITDPNLPRSIYEVDGAREVAIEMGSFSKMTGFTGVRLGWTIVPEELCYDDGSSVKKDWSRIMSTFFNGASNIAQYGGIAALEDKGMREVEGLINYYLDNARIIKETLEKHGIKTYGGTSAPYVWAHFPNKGSWEMFDDLLERAHIITTPGEGFGPAGSGFIRMSAFGNRNDILEAMRRFKKFMEDLLRS